MTAANHESRWAVTSESGVDEGVRGSVRASKHRKALRLRTNAQRSAAEGLPSVPRLRRLGRKLRGESGQSVVEFGMVVPLLCTLVLPGDWLVKKRWSGGHRRRIFECVREVDLRAFRR